MNPHDIVARHIAATLPADIPGRRTLLTAAIQMIPSGGHPFVDMLDSLNRHELLQREFLFSSGAEPEPEVRVTRGEEVA
jgi:hypothetical protein